MKQEDFALIKEMLSTFDPIVLVQTEDECLVGDNLLQEIDLF